MNNCIILENIRSAYNVWTLVRTADALWRDVIVSGYSPDPRSQEKVKKTSLGAEESVAIEWFWHCREAIDYAREKGYTIIASELTDDSLDVSKRRKSNSWVPVALVVGNEVEWVSEETLASVDGVCMVPMKGVKASMNVAQAGAIMMWALEWTSDV